MGTLKGLTNGSNGSSGTGHKLDKQDRGAHKRPKLLMGTHDNATQGATKGPKGHLWDKAGTMKRNNKQV